MKFFYLKAPLLKPSAVLGNFLLKPIIPVKISHNGKSARYAALIDSGADFCIFDAHIGEYLGIDIESGDKEIFGGIQEAPSSVAYFHKIILTVGDWEYKTVVGFSYEIARHGYGILGQHGFFNLFEIIFDYSGGEIKLIPKEEN